jgi:hypothetical protein
MKCEAYMMRIRRFRNFPGAQVDGQIAAVNPQIRHKRRGRLLWIAAFRLWSAASLCFATAGAAAAETRTGPSPVCVAADLNLMTLIEAHGEARDVAPEVLAQAFFTVLEARKACNQGQVEAGMKFYESIPLLPVISETD